MLALLSNISNNRPPSTSLLPPSPGPPRSFLRSAAADDHDHDSHKGLSNGDHAAAHFSPLLRSSLLFYRQLLCLLQPQQPSTSLIGPLDATRAHRPLVASASTPHHASQSNPWSATRPCLRLRRCAGTPRHRLNLWTWTISSSLQLRGHLLTPTIRPHEPRYPIAILMTWTTTLVVLTLHRPRRFPPPRAVWRHRPLRPFLCLLPYAPP